MMKLERILFASIALSGALFAQTPGNLPRPLAPLNRSFTPVGTIDWDAWKVSSPRQRLAADTAKGFAPTANVVHAIFPDLDKTVGFIPTLEYRKSIDGGRTFLPATTLFQLAAQENWTGPQTQLASENQLVFVVYQTDAHDVSSDNEAVYVLASDDQGQTWTGPLLVSTSVTGSSPKNKRGFDSEIKIAVASGICHIVYEATPTGVTSPGEDLYYAAVGITGGKLAIVHAERRINTTTAAGAYDVDGPSVDADRNLVAICWSDDRAKTSATTAPNTVNNHFSVVSINSGGTFAAETKHTKIDKNAPTGWDTRRPKVRVAVPNVYVFQEDSRNGTDDNCYLSFSNDLGVSYKDVEVNKTPAGIDMDEMWMDVEQRRVVVAYRDDRNGTGNVTNNCFVVVSNTAGNDFATAQEVQVTSIDTNNIYGVELRGNSIGISLETDPGESFWLAASDDGGKTFEQFVGTTATPHGDVDSPFMTMTMDSDIVAIWIHDDRNGNSKNNVWTSGIKLPYLVDNTATNKGLALDKALAHAGEVAFVMISQTGTQTPIAFDNMGLTVYLTPDALWQVGASSFAFLFAAVVDAQGNATFPAVPNIKTIIGRDVWAAAVTISGGKFTDGTDAIRFQ